MYRPECVRYNYLFESTFIVFPVLQRRLHLQPLLLELAFLLCHSGGHIILVEYCSLLATCL